MSSFLLFSFNPIKQLSMLELCEEKILILLFPPPHPTMYVLSFRVPNSTFNIFYPNHILIPINEIELFY